MARIYDFYSPFMSAWIVTNPEDPEGSRFPLWVEGVNPDRRGSLVPRTPDGSEGDTSYIEELGSLAFCSEISVELQLAYVPRITATLTPPFREGLAFLNSALIEWGNSTLEVQFGYTGGTPDGIVLSPVFSGTLLKPEVTIGEDISITLNAQGIGAFPAVRQDVINPFPPQPRRKLIKALARTIGLEANFEDVDAPFEAEVARSAREIGDTFGEGSFLNAFVSDRALAWALEVDRKRIYSNAPIDQVISYTPGGLTVWQALYQLVRESRCWVYIQGPKKSGDPEQLRIIPRNTVMTGEPNCTLVLYDFQDGQVGPARNTYPILSVSSPTSAIYLPTATRGYLVFGYKSEERAKVVEFVDPDTDTHRSGNAQTQANASKNNPPLDKKQAKKGKKPKGKKKTVAEPEPLEEVAVLPGAAVASNDSMSPEMNEQLKAEAEGAATNMGVKLEIETLGIPDLLPAQVVAVRGIGARFESGSGNYGVLKVTHTIGASGYTTKIEAVSNVGQLAGTFDRETLPKSPTNENKPKTGEDAENDKVVVKPKPARGGKKK